MELLIPNRKFVCVDYPGIVRNPDKMLETLGGINSVSKTYFDGNTRMELCFRPKSVGCKSAFGDRETCTGLLLKVRRRRRNPGSEPSSSGPSGAQTLVSEQPFEYNAEILGIVDTKYVFQSMSDFQYLPMSKTPNNTYESIRDKVVVSRLKSLSSMYEPVPLFLLPSMFSRLDRPTNYCYRDPPRPRDDNSVAKVEPNVIGISRRRRPHHTRFMGFTDTVVPTSSNPSALDGLKRKRITQDSIDEVLKAFETQSIWSRSALYAHTSQSISLSDLASILPTIAYYMNTGPWRSMWVKFGYDPRQQPEAKHFQNLDVRLRRHIVNDGILIQAKRSSFNYITRNSVPKVQLQAPVIQQSAFSGAAATPSTSKHSTTSENLEATYLFRHGIVPAFRQMFYHLCHVEEPQVQKLVHMNDGKETECLEKDGWCLPGTIDKCREICRQIINSYTYKDVMKSDKTGETRAASSLPPDDENNSDTEPELDQIGEDELESELSSDGQDEMNDMTGSVVGNVKRDDGSDADSDEDYDIDLEEVLMKNLELPP